MKILVIDILGHPKFSLVPDYLEILKKASDDISIEVYLPLNNCNLFPSEKNLVQYQGVIISGSIIKWNSQHEMISNLKIFIKLLYSKYPYIPVLAICMTHELIASIFGAKIELNKNGSELGTITLELTDAGKESMLFKGFPFFFEMQSAHSHDVLSPPLESLILAKNSRCKYQAFQIKNLYCILFHADLSAKSLIKWITTYSTPQELISSRTIKNILEYNNLIKSIYETPYRLMLFKNFLNICKKL